MSLRDAWAAALVLALGAPPLAAQGGSGEGRQRAGERNSECGTDLVVVLPDGARRRYAPVQTFLAGYEAVQIDQGEQPRSAVPLDAILQAHGAAWVEALECANRSRHLPSGTPPVQPREFLVLTGKGTLKAVREVGPGRYANTVQNIRKLTFHDGASGRRPAPPPAAPR